VGSLYEIAFTAKPIAAPQAKIRPNLCFGGTTRQAERGEMRDKWFDRLADLLSQSGPPNRLPPARKCWWRQSCEGQVREQRGKPGKPRHFRNCRGGATAPPKRQTGRGPKQRTQLGAGFGQRRKWLVLSKTFAVPVHKTPIPKTVRLLSPCFSCQIKGKKYWMGGINDINRQPAVGGLRSPGLDGNSSREREISYCYSPDQQVPIPCR
jgi:hypothetical protein